MIPVSLEYKQAINEVGRNIKPKVLVYFNDNETPTEFSGDDIISLQLLEEIGASNSPIGLVSTNEITVVFDNSDSKFSPSNSASPFYGLLRPNIKVVPHLGVEVGAGIFEYVPLGVFKTKDWKSPSNDLTTQVVGYDRLHEISGMDVPIVRPLQNTTVGEMLDFLFRAIGLIPDVDYRIERFLNHNVPIGWFPKGKLRNALQQLAIAGNCNITADRYGVIQVKSNFTGAEPVATYTDDSHIISIDNPQKYSDIYNAVRVNYKTPFISEVQSVMKVNSILVPTSGSASMSFDFSSGPVASVDKVVVTGATNTSIESVEYGSWRLNLVFSNQGPEEAVNLEVFGKKIEAASTIYEIKNPTAATWGEKMLEIDNPLIQSQEAAKSYADSMLQLVADPYSNYVLQVSGDPALEVLDTIRVESNVGHIGSAIIVPVRITLRYNGGLEADIEARKPLYPRQWQFVSPGLYAYVPYAV